MKFSVTVDSAAVIGPTATRLHEAHNSVARNPRALLGKSSCQYGEVTVMDAFDLPPAYVPLGLSAILGLLVAALLARWDARRKHH